MSRRVRVFFLTVVLLSPLAEAKEKKKQILPDYVLEAHTAAVIINPGSQIPLANPSENRLAQDSVERALTKWGRLQPVIDTGTADLVIVVRRGRAVSSTITGGPANDRPVIIQPGEGAVRIGMQTGTPPGVNQSDPRPQEPGPRRGMEVGPDEDLFEVYRGNTQYPLDVAPVWRYMARDALLPPVPAVAQFRKAIEEAEKQQKKKP